MKTTRIIMFLEVVKMKRVSFHHFVRSGVYEKNLLFCNIMAEVFRLYILPLEVPVV